MKKGIVLLIVALVLGAGTLGCTSKYLANVSDQ